MLQLSADDFQRIRNVVHDKRIFLVVDESTLSGIQYQNILIGCLKTPRVSYLYDYQPQIRAPNSNSTAQAVDDAVGFLEISRNSFCLLVSDAAKHMAAAGAILRFLYPKLFHVAHVKHLLHKRAMKSNFTLKMLTNLSQKSNQQMLKTNPVQPNSLLLVARLSLLLHK